MAPRLLVSLLAISVLGWATPAAADDLVLCQDSDHPDISVPACTRLIDGGTETREFLGTLYGFRGLAYFNTGNYVSAIIDMSAALDLGAPGRKDILRLRGWAYLMSGDYEKALADYNEALHPPDAVGLNNRALVYLKMKKYAAAIADYNAALILDPRAPQALYGRGVAESATGDEADGERDKTKARLLQKDIVAAFANWGIR